MGERRFESPFFWGSMKNTWDCKKSRKLKPFVSSCYCYINKRDNRYIYLVTGGSLSGEFGNLS